MNDIAFFRKVYQLYDYGNDDWSELVGGAGGNHDEDDDDDDGPGKRTLLADQADKLRIKTEPLACNQHIELI